MPEKKSKKSMKAVGKLMMDGSAADGAGTDGGRVEGSPLRLPSSSDGPYGDMPGVQVRHEGGSRAGGGLLLPSSDEALVQTKES